MNEPAALSILAERYADKIEIALERAINCNKERVPARLMESMAYSLTAGGKRLRPMLCLAAAENGGAGPDTAMPMALALEFMHTASLIHDDLPCMDNDDLRRGKPTNHKAFGECLALIAGDALMIWSFGYALSGLLGNGVPEGRAARAVSVLAEASGPEGMCGGQVLDTDIMSQKSGCDFVYQIAGKKTAALIRASVVTGAMIAGREETAIRAYADYGAHLGLAFQIEDDILDATGASEQLGKTPGKDSDQNKLTFVSAYGLDGARRLAAEESGAAAEALSPLGEEAELLTELAKQLVNRNH
jgi:geranylgeranyl diphosphate synthase type II